MHSPSETSHRAQGSKKIRLVLRTNRHFSLQVIKSKSSYCQQWLPIIVILWLFAALVGISNNYVVNLSSFSLLILSYFSSDNMPKSISWTPFQYQMVSCPPQPSPLLSALLACSWLASSTSLRWLQLMVQRGAPFLPHSICCLCWL